MSPGSIPITTVRLSGAEEHLVLEVLRSGMLAQGLLVDDRAPDRAATVLCAVRDAFGR